MKKKEKRKSRSANSFLRQILTCGGIVPNCADSNSAQQQQTDQESDQLNRRDSRTSSSSRNLLTSHQKSMSQSAQHNLVSDEIFGLNDEQPMSLSIPSHWKSEESGFEGQQKSSGSKQQRQQSHPRIPQSATGVDKNRSDYDDEEEDEEYEENEGEEEQDADDDLDDEEEPYDDDEDDAPASTKKSNNLLICNNNVTATASSGGKKMYESDEDLVEKKSKPYSKKLGDHQSQSRSSRNNSNRSSLKLSSSANPIICTPSSNLNESNASTGAGIELFTAAREIPSFSFHTDDQNDEMAQSNDDLLTSKHQIQQQQQQQQKSQQQPHLLPSSAFYSKFLTGSNIITDRGCIVNVRTGSFNLGCQTNSPSSSAMSLMPGYLQGDLNDTELINSDQFFSSLDHQYSSNDFLRNSASNYSVRTSFNSSLDIRSSNNNNNYRASSNNVLIPLLLVTQCRKKSLSGGDPNAPSTCTTIGPATVTKSTDSINICGTNPIIDHTTSAGLSGVVGGIASNQIKLNDKLTSTNQNSTTNNNNTQATRGGSFLTANTDQQDQFRRCSHDPNIEKLHKNYINNVKLASNNLSSYTNSANTPMFSSASVSSANTDSIPNVSLNQQHLVRFANTDNSLDAEKSDQVYDISKVNTWLKDNTNNGNAKNGSGGGAIQYKKRPLHYFTSTTISEDEDNYDARMNQNRSTSMVAGTTTTMTTKPKQLPHQQNEVTSEDSMNNKASNDEENAYEASSQADSTAATKTYETADSAIDMRSYGSLSIHSKASSSKSRTNWQSFSKSYRLYFQSTENTWSKYQISAMSLEQIMSLRKLALIQFSKLVERQHSNMIRKLRIFSKKLSAAEFQKVYDSIDSVNGSTRLDTIKSGTIGKEFADGKKSGEESIQETSVVIDSKKVSHQLGAQMGMYPSSVTKKMAEAAAPPTNTSVRKKRGKNSIKKKDDKISSASNINSSTSASKNQGTSNNSSSLLQFGQESQSKREFSSHNYSTVSNEESSSSIILDYDYVNMTFSPTNQLENKLLESEHGVQADEPSHLISGGVNNKSNNSPFGAKTHKHKTFGLPLNVIMQLTGQPLPQQIIEAMRLVRRTAANEIGIFRKNGNKARINKLRELIDKHESINFQTSDLTIFDIADTIKLYFRELPECLITNKLSNILLSSYSKTPLEERKNILQQVMLLIPDENRLVLQTLLLFLNDIAKHHKVNQMTRTNLAVVFSPVIFSLDYTDNKKKLKALKTQMASNYSYSSLSKQPTITTINPLVSISSISSGSEKQLLDLKSSSILKSSLEQIDNNSSSNQTQQSTPTESPSPVVSSSMINSVSQSTAADLHSSMNARVPKTSSVDTSSDQRKMAKASFSQETKSSSQQSQDFPDSNIAAQSSKLSKYSDKIINKATNSFVSFGGGEISKESLESFESMNKVVQSCVADMIKYSMDLFTVPIENFEKLRLSICGSEPHSLDSLYDLESRKLKKFEFFAGNVNIDKTFWSYFDKFDDVSIYYFKNEYQQQLLLNKSASNSNLTNSSSVSTSTINNPPSSNQSSQQQQQQPYYVSSNMMGSTPNQPSLSVSSTSYPTISSSLFIPQANECFSEKLKLWKCCTLVKKPNLTLEKILNRIKKERYLWDDDFKDGRIVEQLDEHTEIYRYVMSFLPPHPSRDFFELRHTSIQKTDNQIAILTSISVKKQSGNKLVGDIRANMFISKYVIEQLIATDTTTTFKITHYIKLDYKGFTLEFYNRTFGYMMARLLYNLKMSLINPDTASPPPNEL